MDANNKNIASKLPVLFSRVVSSRTTANNTEAVGKILQPKNPNINKIGSKIPVVSKKVVVTKTTPVNTKKALKSSVGKLLQQKNQNLNLNLNKKQVPKKHTATSMTNKLVKNANRSTAINSKKRISRSFDDIEIITPNTILSSTPSNPCFLQPDHMHSANNNRLSISFRNYLSGSSNLRSLTDNSNGDCTTSSQSMSSCVEEKSSKSANKDLELLTPTRLDRVDFLDLNIKSRTPELYLISQEEVTLFDITVEDGYCVRKSEHIISSSCSSIDGDKTNRSRKCLGKWENIMNNIERNKLDKKSLPKIKDVQSKVFQRSSNNENCLILKDRSEKKKCLGTIRNSKEKLCKKPRNDSKISNSSVENDIDTDNAKIIKEDKSNCEHINLLNQLKHATKGFDALAVLIQHLVFDLEAYKVPELKQSLETMKFNYAKLNEDCEKIRQHPSNSSSSTGADSEQGSRSPKATSEKKPTEVMNSKHNFDDYKHLITKNENEIKSLQTVLDIKMVEMNDLRLKANNLQRENEKLKSTATKVPYLESRIQKLEVQLSNKANKEQNLLLENKKKEEELTLQINRNQDQARIIEQLRYKLKRRSETSELLYCPESPLKSSNSNRNSASSFADCSVLRGRDSTMYYSISDGSQVPFSSPESPRVKSYVERSASASWVLEIDDTDDFIGAITNSNNNSGNNGSEPSVPNSRSKNTSLSYSKK